MSPRAVATVAGLVGALSSAWPLRGLFADPTWWTLFAVVAAAVALVGALARATDRPAAAVLGAQALVLVGLLVLFFGGPTLLAGVVPTPATIGHLLALAREGAEALRDNPAPVPRSPGLDLVLTSTLSVVALAVDALAVTLARPVVAGLALLTPFLTAVANGDGDLTPLHFVLTSACWLVLLAATDRHRTATGAGARTRRRVRARGALVAAAALVFSVVVAGLLPHMPVRYLAEGYGTASGPTRVGFSPGADMLADLESTDSRAILRYRTDAPEAEPLRASVATTYADATWHPDAVRAEPSSAPQLPPPVGLARDVPRQARTVEVDENRLQAPYLATPSHVVQGSVTDARWGMDRRTGVIAVDQMPPRYRMQFLDVDPTPAQLRAAGGSPADSRRLAAARDTSGATPAVKATAQRITAGARTHYDRAVAIQDWFRDSGEFTYSLELAPAPEGMSQSEAARTAVDRFLQTKRGYCVQYSTAMTLMARSVGIPARVATGFLPGTDEDGTRVVRASDAHAWPELYFEDVGWLRFEPTPGARSGQPPPYAAPEEDPGPEGTETSPAPTPSAPEESAAPTDDARPENDPDAAAEREPGAAAAQDSPAARPVVVAVVAAAFLLGLLLLLGPALARRARRRELDATSDPADVVELRWQQLLGDLDDLGLPVRRSAAPRAQAAELRESALLDDAASAAAGRLAEAVTAARYAPGPTARWSTEDADAVRSAARARRGPLERLRARVWPSDATREVGRLASAAGSRRPFRRRR